VHIRRAVTEGAKIDMKTRSNRNMRKRQLSWRTLADLIPRLPDSFVSALFRPPALLSPEMVPGKERRSDHSLAWPNPTPEIIARSFARGRGPLTR